MARMIVWTEAANDSGHTPEQCEDGEYTRTHKIIMHSISCRTLQLHACHLHLQAFEVSIYGMLKIGYKPCTLQLYSDAVEAVVYCIIVLKLTTCE